MNVHRLKSWPRLFAAICSGEKTHELRKDDRGFQVGDLIDLLEYDPGREAFTGRERRVEITYITDSSRPCALSQAALADGYCILSVRLRD
ncbi:MAG TPA: DUF3850 domain-containing protein [Allosphingosinicella sp.]|jgi:hypothetical protein